MFSPRYRQRLRRGLIVLSSAIALLFCMLDGTGHLDWLENRSADLRVTALIDPAKADSAIVIIDIDNISFEALKENLGRWPWTRRVWTELLDYLTSGHPKLVLFDFLFDGEEPGADPGFADAIQSAGNVILPFAFTSAEGELEDRPVPPAKARIAISGVPGRELSASKWLPSVPTPRLDRAIAASGGALGNADPDGVTRRLPLVSRYEGSVWTTFWLAAALRASGAKEGNFSTGEFRAGPIRLPVDREGNFIVRWHGTPLDTYKRIPLFEMVCSMHPEICEPNAPRHPPAEFANKIVLVGSSAAGAYEVRPIAISETAPGVFIVASAIDNLLHNDAITRTPPWLTWTLVIALVALTSWPAAVSRSSALPLRIALGVLVLYGGFCFLAYSRAIWLPMSAPMLAVVVSFSANTAFRYLRVDRELSRTRNTLEAYVAPQLVSYVMDNLDSFRFDGQKRKLTILFSDVRGFTTLTEKSDPVALLKQLNEYLEAMTDIIFKYEGIVDKFIGDGIMAHWGAFTPDHPNAQLAARAALEMMEKLAELNRGWEAAGSPPLDIGIGLNTGEVIFGNVGAGKKLDFTAIGDGVNLAARLEGANKEYKTHIIISDATRAELGPAAEVSPLGTIVVKGKTVGVEIFELRALQ